MNSKVYKWCAVPQCDNTSKNAPSKLFVYVPHKKIIRYKWLNLARRDPTAIRLKSPIYFCEDHFDMPNDMENYFEYHVMGSVSKIRMKPGCIPTKFECQSKRRKRKSTTRKRTYILKKRRKMLTEECEKNLDKRNIIAQRLEFGEASSGNTGTSATNNMAKQTIETDLQGVAQDVMKNEQVDESMQFMEQKTPIKQEPLDQDCPEICHNVYDLYFEVLKHELCDNSSE